MRSAPPLTWTNIISYGLGDIANNFVFAMGALFLLNYYTDVVGISAAAAGTMLALIRIYNAVTDVVAGHFVDQTSTRWGSCRPFILFGGPPLLLLSVIVFSVPADWSTSGKLLFAYLSYGLLVTTYSFVNIPYGSLAAAMTQVPSERARLSASRTLMSVCASTFLFMVFGPILSSVHGTTLQTDLTLFTLILAVVGGVMYFLCFKNTRENIEREIERPKLKESISTLLVNRPLQILCVSTVCSLIGAFSMNASAVYFAQYVLGDTKQFFFVMGIATLVGVLIAAPLTPLLTSSVGKKNTLLLGLAVAVLGYSALFFSPAFGNAWIFSSLGVAIIGNMMCGSVIWALAADTVEYGEWYTGVRIEGLTYSLFSFSRKCGQAIGGSVPAFLLAASDYVPNLAIQSETARLGIVQAMALAPAISFALAFISILFYPLTDLRFSELVREIETRRVSKISAIH